MALNFIHDVTVISVEDLTTPPFTNYVCNTVKFKVPLLNLSYPVLCDIYVSPTGTNAITTVSLLNLKKSIEALAITHQNSEELLGNSELYRRIRTRLSEVDNLVIPTTSFTLSAPATVPFATLGIDQHSCASLYLAQLRSFQTTKIPVKPGAVLLTEDEKYNICTLYLNAYLMVLPTPIFLMTLTGLRKIAHLPGVELTFCSSSESSIECDERFAIITAFLFASAITKSSGESSNINDWIRKRIPPLLIASQMEQLEATVIPAAGTEVLVIGSKLEVLTKLREAIYEPLISSSHASWDVRSGLHSQLLMVLEYTGMTTFRQAYQFAQTCGTHAHLLDIIVDQSMYVQGKWKNDDKFKFKWLLNGQDPDLSIKNYPDLAYCAISQKQTTEDSWKNYRMSDSLALSNDKKIYNKLIATPLDISEERGASDKVKKYLQSKGRKLPQSQDPTNLMTLLTTLLTSRNIVTEEQMET